MTTAWVVVSIILVIIWVIAFCIGIGFTIANPDNMDTDERKQFFRGFAAVMSAALVFVFAHWIVLLLVIPVFFIYGLTVGVKILVAYSLKRRTE